MKNIADVVSSISKTGNLLLVLVVFALSACTTTQEQESAGSAKSESTTTSVSSEKAEQNTQTSVAGTDQAKQEAASSAEPAGKVEADKKEEPLRIVESCKAEPYVKYEKASLASMEKGLAATKAKKYGVGFRSVSEYKRWRDIHDKLFAKVNESCATLKQCAKQNPKDKTKKCANEAFVFNEWQNMAKRFTTRAKMVETTQPDEICSFKPNLKDVSQCFHTLADNVDKVCNSAECKDLGNCWRDVGFLGDAMNQAEEACQFVHKALSDCGAYTLAKSRREKRFAECKELDSEVDIVRLPPL
jgi:hypothetical protein